MFDQTGRAFVVLGKAIAEGVPADEIAKSLMVYFGPFTINDTGDIVSVAVESSNMPDYVGSTQTRQFKIEGDRMTIGTPGQYQATLRRATLEPDN